MHLSARRAHEEMQRTGWQEAARDAWNRWSYGRTYDPQRGMNRYMAALIIAANWDLERNLDRSPEKRTWD